MNDLIEKEVLDVLNMIKATDENFAKFVDEQKSRFNARAKKLDEQEEKLDKCVTLAISKNKQIDSFLKEAKEKLDNIEQVEMTYNNLVEKFNSAIDNVEVMLASKSNEKENINKQLDDLKKLRVEITNGMTIIKNMQDKIITDLINIKQINSK